MNTSEIITENFWKAVELQKRVEELEATLKYERLEAVETDKEWDDMKARVDELERFLRLIYFSSTDDDTVTLIRKDIPNLDLGELSDT